MTLAPDRKTVVDGPVVAPRSPDGTRHASLPPPPADRATRLTPIPASAPPHDLADEATDVDADGRIVITLRRRSDGAAVARYAVSVGKTATLARRALKLRESFSDASPPSRPASPPPPPELPLDSPAVMVPVSYTVLRRVDAAGDHRAWMLAVVAGVVAFMLWLIATLAARGTP